MADKTVAFRPFPGHSFSITGSESDAGVVGELERSGGLYQRDLAELLQQRLAPDAVVVDVGAHIGVVTSLLAALCPKGHVYSFEPVVENHAHLTANVASNRFDNVTVERAALFDCDGEISLEYDAAYPGGSHVGAGGATVAAVRFDTWAARTGLDRLDLVKLDVEGVELAVLDGAAETFSRFRPILVVECNPVALLRFGQSTYAALLRRLSTLFPFVGVIAPGGHLRPLASAEHLRLILARRGVIDLVGLPAMPASDRLRYRARAAVELGRMLRDRNRRQLPDNNFLIDPGGITLHPVAAQLAGPAGETVILDVDVRNGSRSWLSSAFSHPVNVSYRWLDAGGVPTLAEGHRSGFPAPLGPGDSGRVPVSVGLPAEPGRYTLGLTMVQEHFVWLDELDPRCRVPVAVTVS